MKSGGMEARRSQSSTNGRRRRLLANQDTDDLLAEFEALAPQATTTPAPGTTVIAPDRQILHRMVSGQLWKHGLIVLAVMLLASAAIWSEIYQPLVLQELAATRQPRISKGLAGVFLVVAGQLALIIGWIRSRSAVDFSGRYRCWKWLAGCLVSIGCLWSTNLQDALPQLAETLAEPLIGSIGAARRTLVIVPLAGLSIWVLSRVVPDMGRHRSSQALFIVSVLAALVRLLMSYGASLDAFSPPILDGTLLTSAGLLVCSLLLHTRFVLYISKDPPERTLTAATRGDQPGSESDQLQPETNDLAAEDLTAEPIAAKSDGTATSQHGPATDNDKSQDVVTEEATASARNAETVGQKERKRRRSKRGTRKAA
ncbi:MAG: hypothetical protein ABGZ35_32805 [Planctomycetaceae bacterium]